MTWPDLMVDGYNRVPGFIQNVLSGLTRDDLDWRPRADCNSMGWLIWHLTRQQDAQISSLMGEEQIWERESRHKKFDLPAGPEDIGFGHTPEQIAAFRSPGPEVLMDYLGSATKRTCAWIQALSEAELGRELNEPRFQPLPTVGVRIVSVLEDSQMHAGQAAYVRGLLQGKGWQAY